MQTSPGAAAEPLPRGGLGSKLGPDACGETERKGLVKRSEEGDTLGSGSFSKPANDHLFPFST
jgi:hypothetical protein